MIRIQRRLFYNRGIILDVNNPKAQTYWDLYCEKQCLKDLWKFQFCFLFVIEQPCKLPWWNINLNWGLFLCYIATDQARGWPNQCFVWPHQRKSDLEREQRQRARNLLHKWSRVLKWSEIFKTTFYCFITWILIYQFNIKCYNIIYVIVCTSLLGKNKVSNI